MKKKEARKVRRPNERMPLRAAIACVLSAVVVAATGAAAAKKKASTKGTFHRAISPLIEGIVSNGECRVYRPEPSGGMAFLRCEDGTPSADGYARYTYSLALSSSASANWCSVSLNGKKCRSCDPCGLLAKLEASFDCGNLLKAEFKNVPDGECAKPGYRCVGQDCVSGKCICKKKTKTKVSSCKKVGETCFRHATGRRACCGKCWTKRRIVSCRGGGKAGQQVKVRIGVKGSCETRKRYVELLTAFRRRKNRECPPS